MKNLIHQGHDIQITKAEVDDWTDILSLREYVIHSKANNYITADLDSLKAFLHHAYTYPEKVGFLLCWWGPTLVGMTALLLTDQPVVTSPGIAFARQAFIHSVYIAPWVWNRSRVEKIRVPVYAGEELMAGIEKWALAPRPDGLGGAKFIYGNVRLDGNFRAFFEKYGFERQSVVIGKPLG